MEQVVRVTIGAGGQVVVPLAWLARLGLQPGDRLTILQHEQGLLLQPLPLDVIDAGYGVSAEFWRALGGSADYLREIERSWRS